MEIGRNIANYRKLKRLTQKELAETIGMSRGHIVAIERGRRIPKIKTLARIAECLGVDLELLFIKGE
jgi:transcriptional regulator with XRE-family HTH domain